MATAIRDTSFAFQRTIAALKESSHFNTALAWSAFLVSRILFLYVQLVVLPKSCDCDVRIYARYAAAYVLASQNRTSVYDYCTPEYPHLALAVLALPRAAMMDIDPEPVSDPEGFELYRSFFRLEMGLFDLLAFATLFWLVKRWFGHESAWQQSKRLLLFVAGGLLLPTLLYTRLDLALGSLVLLSLALLVSGRHYLWSFAVLAVAINFKLVPIVLMPVWVIASAPPALVGGFWLRGGVMRLLAVCSWRTAVAVALTVALAVPAYLSSGGRSLDFLAYHKERGLEIGSCYSTALLLLKPFGWPEQFGFGYGSLNIDAPGAPIMVRLAPLATCCLLAAVTVVSCFWLVRAKYAERREANQPAGETLAVTAGCAALVVAVFIAGNKVFSPQYLLWLLPLIPLLPLSNVRWRLCAATFAAACILSTATMVVWQHHVVGDDDWTDTVTSVPGPTPLGRALLIARNVAFLGLVVLLARRPQLLASHIAWDRLLQGLLCWRGPPVKIVKVVRKKD
jgi:hypothetical protein